MVGQQTIHSVQGQGWTGEGAQQMSMPVIDDQPLRADFLFDHCSDVRGGKRFVVLRCAHMAVSSFVNGFMPLLFLIRVRRLTPPKWLEDKVALSLVGQPCNSLRPSPLCREINAQSVLNLSGIPEPTAS